MIAPIAAALLVVLTLPPLVSSRARRRHRSSLSVPVAVAASIRARVPRMRSLRRPRHRSVVTPAAVGAWCDELARGLRHGSTLRNVLTDVVPADAAVANRTARLRHRLDRGAVVADACDGWSDDLSEVRGSGIDLLATFATVRAAGAVLGGNVAEPIDRFAATMRQRTSDDLERASNSAQARMSARVLTLVPLAVLTVLLVTDHDVRTVITTPAGAVVLGLGLVMNAAGGVWMHRIARGPSGSTR